MAISVDPDQTALIRAVCSGSTLFASILYLSVMLGNYLQQTTSADDISRCIFFLALFRVKWYYICMVYQAKTIFMFYSSTLRLPKIVTSGSHVCKGNIEERIRVCYHEIKQFKKKYIFKRI